MTLILKGFDQEQKRLWQDFVKEVNGVIIDGGKFNPDTLVYKYKVWTVVLEEVLFMVPGTSSGELITRLKIPIVNKRRLNFKVHKEDLIMKVFKCFGSQDIQVGDSELDKTFMIEGNDKIAIRKVLIDDLIKDMMLSMQQAFFSLRADEEKHGDEFPEGVDLLEIYLTGKIGQFRTLMAFHKVLTRTCDILTEFDKSFGTDPDIRLV